MSKKCQKCGCSEIDQTGRYVDGSVSYKCRKCGTHFMLFTVFKTITTSPEVLADKLVYCVPVPLFEHGAGLERWYTVFSPFNANEFFGTKEEAIAATVAKLKEVCDA